jgi:hypothetical protein
MRIAMSSLMALSEKLVRIDFTLGKLRSLPRSVLE